MFTTPTSSVKRKNGFFYGLTPTMLRQIQKEPNIFPCSHRLRLYPL
jgi:hypothetical protein